MEEAQPKRGGARPGAGRPVADIQLDQEHALMLKHVMEAQEIAYSSEAASAYVMRQIAREHQMYTDEARKKGYAAMDALAADMRRRENTRLR